MATDEPVGAARSTARAGAAIRTLVVEDDPVAARAHAHHVSRQQGFTVVGVAGSGAEALAFIETGDVDLVLLDLHLPDLTGLEVMRRLRSAGRPIDVIVVSSARESDAVRAAVAQGAVQYLIKPFASAALRDRLTAYRSFRAQVQVSDRVAQEDVDRAFAVLRTPLGAPLPKGLTPQTLELVSAALRRRDDASAVELAEELGISRITAGRYLAHLVETGVARRGHRYGQVGRPESRYRLADH
ncbi:response regulator [Nakamurella alba]|uniref:response regulator n=1 Tax=Nakamurella alba TaxID=2665158 RepID=UPI002AC31B3D|nr:response regulator [Nakamurella alba]